MSEERATGANGAGAVDDVHDGIVVGDRPVPRWWNFVFLGTIVLGVCSATFAFMSPAFLWPEERWSVERHAHMERMFSSISGIPLSDEKMLMLMGDAKWREMGARIYALRCAQCHGASGEGLVGPNLTDDHYKTVRVLTDIVGVITDGSGGGTMPAQRFALGEGEIAVVGAYVASLRGGHVEGPRPAEGEVIGAWDGGR